jgi:parallel beta-helix repeat protein
MSTNSVSAPAANAAALNARVSRRRGVVVAAVSAACVAAAMLAAPGVAGATGTPATRGSVAVGAAAYAVPAGAVFVDSNTGSDTAAGTVTAPLRTVAAAAGKVLVGGTVVLRAGTYHEKLTLTKNNVTIQAYPGEPVWLDGSSQVNTFTPNGSGDYVTPWTTTFDHSASFTFGDNSAPGNNGWLFVNPAYPMAAWPDEVFLDGVAQAQVAANPGVGQFAVDYTAKTLTIGSDPAGHRVDAATLDQGINVYASNVTLRGFGVRRYATTLPQMGTINLQGAGDTLQNLQIDDSATEAINLGAQNLIDHVSIHRAGMTGIHSNHASGSIISNSVVTGSDSEHFNAAPAAAGIKLSRSTNMTVTNNQVTDNNNTVGIWLDENVIGFTITSNDASNNSNAGIMIELSGTGIIADNTLTGNLQGLYAFDAGDLKIFNNNFGSNGTASIYLSQDDRYLPGHSTAGASVQPSAANPWLTQNITINNNIFDTNGGPYGFQIWALDKKTNIPANNMNITITGNLFHTKTATTDTMIAWGQNDNKTVVRYDTPTTLNTGTNHTWTNNQTPTGTNTITAATLPANTTITTPLPTDIATATTQPTGTQHLGTF